MTTSHGGDVAVIADLLRRHGRADAVDRMSRCVAARRGRHRNGGWPYRCRLAACPTCGPRLAARWWSGMEVWAASGGRPVLSCVLPPRSDVGLGAVGRLAGRALRDLRDRRARRDRLWGHVVALGMVAADRRLHLLFVHPGLPAATVEQAIRRRWPAADFPGPPPSFSWSVEDTIALALARRGVEPIRVVVLRQGGGLPQAEFSPPDATSAASREPLPFVVG